MDLCGHPAQPEEGWVALPREKILKFQHSESMFHGVLEVKSVITTRMLERERVRWEERGGEERKE